MTYDYKAALESLDAIAHRKITFNLRGHKIATETIAEWFGDNYHTVMQALRIAERVVQKPSKTLVKTFIYNLPTKHEIDACDYESGCETLEMVFFQMLKEIELTNEGESSCRGK